MQLKHRNTQHKKSVLITRPLGQAENLTNQIKALGLNPLLLPIFRIEPLNNAEIKAKILDFDQYDTIIVTSKNAAAQLGWWLDTYWLQLPAQQTFLAIGQSTAQTLAQYHIKALVPQAMHSEGLIELIQQKHPQYTPQNILLCKGENGRQLLEQTLKQQISTKQKTRLDTMVVYRRKKLQHHPADLVAKLQQADLLLCTSEETLKAMTEISCQTQIPIKHLPLIVSSQRLKRIAADLAFTSIYLSENAMDMELINAVKFYLSSTLL